ncbi:MAG: flagellar hook-length control protein FliK, partial [Planctomycetes bacterium]|nr:flagellar hook-length control protein FliK [Planctomycetota bacterium]
ADLVELDVAKAEMAKPEAPPIEGEDSEIAATEESSKASDNIASVPDSSKEKADSTFRADRSLLSLLESAIEGKVRDLGGEDKALEPELRELLRKVRELDSNPEKVSVDPQAAKVELRKSLLAGLGGTSVRRSGDETKTEKSGIGKEDDVRLSVPVRNVARVYGVGPASVKIAVEAIVALDQVAAPQARFSSEGQLLTSQSVTGVGGELAKNVATVEGRENIRSVNRQDGAEMGAKVILSVKESIRLWSGKGMTAMRVSLDPPELGHMELRTVMVKDKMGVSLSVESQAVREILQANGNELKNLLNGKGLDLVQLDIFERNMREKGGRPQRGQQRDIFDVDALLGEGNNESAEVSRGYFDRVA